ncbi:uncharacterized protein Fot_48343 [Forsythia ovata]|uniref:B box-type domain-containing protein n=1 Tax=Forsythia ovata TaxID=205694 RepID=A0ABD1Q8R7_9LAMI
MSKKGCELCSNPARMYCESDQASLCWNCDEKVHSANFLVAKHSRNLLCHVCQSSTSWKASGLKIGPTVCICHVCADGENGGSRRRQANQEEEDEDYCEVLQESEDDDEQYYSEDEEEEEVEEGENQVDEDGCCSSQFNPKATASEIFSTSYGELTEYNGSSSSSSFRPLKLQRESAINEDQTANMESRKAAIIASLRKFQQESESSERDVSAMIIDLRKLTRD